MADKKISALTGATTPLAGTEVLPIVQSGATVKVAVSDLTAGRAISATQLTLTAGNVIPANGFGIDFSATSGTGTSELLADYEEGTWTPTLVFSGGAGTLSYATRIGKYTKIGRVVYFHMGLTFSKGTASGTLDSITGLPFAAIDSANGGGVFIDGMSLLTGATEYTVDSSTLYVYVSTTGSAAAINATNMGASSNVLRISGFYAT